MKTLTELILEYQTRLINLIILSHNKDILFDQAIYDDEEDATILLRGLHYNEKELKLKVMYVDTKEAEGKRVKLDNLEQQYVDYTELKRVTTYDTINYLINKLMFTKK